MNIVFMGTPNFAVPTLEYIINENHNIGLVVTQPDKPRGRGKKVSFSPVKEKAVEKGLEISQPVNIKKEPEFIEVLKKIGPDLIVVVAFGQILPKEVLELPKYGCINVHASLLPRLRGAAPINWSIINGDKETGITTMYMDAGLDTGDMLVKRQVNIGEDETAGELHDRLKVLGAEALIQTLKLIESEELVRTPQDGAQSTYAPMLSRDTGHIRWNENSENIRNLIRGTDPWPGAYSHLQGAKMKIWKGRIEEDVSASGKPGQIWKVSRDGIHVYTGDGGIIIEEVQIEGGKRTNAYSYTLGHAVDIGCGFEW